VAGGVVTIQAAAGERAGGRPDVVPGGEAARAVVHATGGGPLLAVCGLCGGAGASTLAYLTAQAAARDGNGPVLVCDSGGPTGGLAAYAGVESARSLPALANAIAAYEPVGAGLFADGAPGLRVIASRPQLDDCAAEDGVARVLRDARQAHALTVVDCGSAGSRLGLQILGAATHVAWVLPATVSGLERGARVVGLFGVEQSRHELVVARYDGAGRKPPIEELGGLAAARGAPLVLMPHVPDLDPGRAEEALEAAELSLDAILMALRR
jgi:Flp pilus assembly CpaE family ATPase